MFLVITSSLFYFDNLRKFRNRELKDDAFLLQSSDDFEEIKRREDCEATYREIWEHKKNLTTQNGTYAMALKGLNLEKI